MKGKLAIGVLLFYLVLIIVACSAPVSMPVTNQKPEQIPTSQTEQSNPKPQGPIKAKWIEPQVNGSAISIPVNEVNNNWNTHFKVNMQGSLMNFMAFTLDGDIYVRANVCPPCKSIGFSLDKDILVCDRCATTFKAKTGVGIQGACVNYPKAAVPYKIIDGNIIMNETDLANAYQDTIKPG